MAFTDPWHLTVIRMSGPHLLRYEEPWRPIVSISVVDNDRELGLPHQVMLDSDGRNPNLKSSIPVHEVNATTKLIIQVFHHPLAQVEKKHMKRDLAGSASLSLHEFLSKHPPPRLGSVDYDVQLACYPPQCKSSTIGGKQEQEYNATLTVRFKLHRSSESGPSQLESPPLSPVSKHYETEPLPSDAPSSSRAQSETPFSGEESYLPETPEDKHFPAIYEDGHAYGEREEMEVLSPSVLPVHAGMESEGAEASFGERCLCWISPYEEIREAATAEGGDCEKAEKVLARLLAEWCFVGMSLLALAGVGAALARFAPEGLFVLEGFPLGALTVGVVAALFGLVCDAWFLVLYSSANGAEFLDMFDTYFCFSLTCHLPTLFMALSTVSLVVFLLAAAAAWTAWLNAVVVMAFATALLLSTSATEANETPGPSASKLPAGRSRTSTTRVATRAESVPAPQKAGRRLKW